MGILAFLKSILDALTSYAGPIIKWIVANQNKQDQFFKDIGRDDQSRQYDATRAELEKKTEDALAEDAKKMREQASISGSDKPNV